MLTKSTLTKSALALAIAGAVLIGSVGDSEARRRIWPWVAGGVAAGVLLGAAAAQSRGYYAPYYYDAPAYYVPPPAPVYVAPEPYYAAPPAPVYAPAPSGCWVWTDRDRGYGYYRC